MARFTPVPGLDEIVARMVAPEQRRFAERVEDTAKALAPPTKTWVHIGDGRVRTPHMAAGGQEVPDNLRFDLTSFEWDVMHPAVGSLRKGTPGGDGWAGQMARTAPGHTTWMLYPRDQTPAAFVQAVNCRCSTTLNPDGISKLISTEATTVVGTRITTTVAAVGKWVIEAEYGTVYPSMVGDLVAEGTFFMTKAAAGGGGRR